MTRSTERRRVVTVAMAAAVIGVALYILSVIVVDVIVVHRSVTQIDARLTARLTLAQHDLASGALPATVVRGSIPSTDDEDDPPISLWIIEHGMVVATSEKSPVIPSHPYAPGVTTVAFGSSTYRVHVSHEGTYTLIAGQSTVADRHLVSLLIGVEIIAGFVLALLMFAAAFIVGNRALAPVARARQRLRDFTADASHELRTPLAVIEAEVDVALRRERTIEEYQQTLARISSESRRLSRIVHDLLWLARADNADAEATPNYEVDVAAIVQENRERYEAMATVKGVTLACDTGTDVNGAIIATREGIDRLLGVVVDNACKFAGFGGRVSVSLRNVANRVELTIEDSGPGIPPQERDLVFERFHRAPSDFEGTGLGLAIASEILASTNGECVIDSSVLGGALFRISWRNVT